jgi:hypothetical protein
VFSYGDSRVSANVMVAAYNLTDSSWKDLTAQLGINEAWVTVNLPEFFGPRGGLIWNVGAFHGGYGGLGATTPASTRPISSGARTRSARR